MDRYVVSFKRKLQSPQELFAAVNAEPARFVDGTRFLIQSSKGLADDNILHFPEIGVLSAVMDSDEAERLRQDPRVESIRVSREVGHNDRIEKIEDHGFHALGEEGGITALPWHVESVRADRCWPRTTGKGVKVGIIDSEIDRDLPDLPIKAGASFHPDAADWFGTDDFHGTFCAGIIGCRNTSPMMVGIAPECDLYALRINKDGRGRSEYMVAAMLWAAQHKLDIVSLSQWNFGVDDPHAPPWVDVGRAADELVRAGCIVIGIAGNSGAQPNHWVTNPGRCHQIVAVGATNQDSTWWGQSSYGPPDLIEEEAVEIAAPGNDILSIFPGGGFGRGQGTSFAAPQVAGACALIKQVEPGLTPAELRTRLKRTSVDLDPIGRDEKFGAGFLDCLAALSP